MRNRATSGNITVNSTCSNAYILHDFDRDHEDLRVAAV
jgi:hypothetical protein